MNLQVCACATHTFFVPQFLKFCHVRSNNDPVFYRFCQKLSFSGECQTEVLKVVSSNQNW